ncbi:hypothetical protein [Leptolyngbya ohadii]|nr:hypothetical protein [Leptolyngbya ohadii]
MMNSHEPSPELSTMLTLPQPIDRFPAVLCQESSKGNNRSGKLD